MSAVTEVGLQVNRLAIDVDTHRLAMALLAAGNAETVTILAGVNGTPQPLPPPVPAPPPPPPPDDGVGVPAGVRAMIGEAEAMARALIEAARPLGELSRQLARDLEAVNRARGGDDLAFDALVASTDRLSGLQEEICRAVTGDDLR